MKRTVYIVDIPFVVQLSSDSGPAQQCVDNGMVREIVKAALAVVAHDSR